MSIFDDMIRLLFTLALAFLINPVYAQSHICLQEDGGTNQINFRAEDFNRFTHLDNYRIVFFGEQHNTVFDPEIKYHLITDLYRRSGIRHLFIEASVSRAWHYNQYLNTGDTSHLYVSNYPLAMDGYIVFWKRLYEFNKGLPEGSKIAIHGVDFETTAVFPTLKQLSPPTKPIPISLQPMMDTVNAHSLDKPLHMWEIINNKFILYDNSGFVKTLRFIQKALLDHDDDVMAYFGENYRVVHEIAINSGQVEVKARNRNKTMFAGIERLLKEEHVDRFVGFFGNQHTKYSVHNSLPNVVKRLKGFSGKDILTIAEFAYNLKFKDTGFRQKKYNEFVALNQNCKASVHRSNAVPRFGNESDFVIIANITE